MFARSCVNWDQDQIVHFTCSLDRFTGKDLDSLEEKLKVNDFNYCLLMAAELIKCEPFMDKRQIYSSMLEVYSLGKFTLLKMHVTANLLHAIAFFALFPLFSHPFHAATTQGWSGYYDLLSTKCQIARTKLSKVSVFSMMSCCFLWMPHADSAQINGILWFRLKGIMHQKNTTL